MEIKSLNKLACILGVRRALLCELADNAPLHYRPYLKPKRSGKGFRTIDHPGPQIIALQRKIDKNILQNNLNIYPQYAFCGICGKSIRSSAIPHANHNTLLSIDLKDCFPSIKYDKIYRVFVDLFGATPKVARVLTKLTTYRGHLPQGSPCSTHLAILVLKRTFDDIYELCEKQGCTMTQNVDDIYISGDKNNINETVENVFIMLKAHKLKPNRSKSGISSGSRKREVAGMMLNNGSISVSKRKRRKIMRRIIRARTHPEMLRSVRSQAYYVKSINERQGRKLLQEIE